MEVKMDKGTRQTVWLIEANGTYWDGSSLTKSAFVKGAGKAVRFSRFEDAEKVKYWLMPDHAFALKSTEHVWMADTRPSEP
jgi:hypothetical protein